MNKCLKCDRCIKPIYGGICPIVSCPKSLINGPCGGAINGKCEVCSSRDCIWYIIEKRIDVNSLPKGNLDFKDYSKTIQTNNNGGT